MTTQLPDAVAALLLDMELSREERDSINPFLLLDLEYPNGPCPSGPSTGPCWWRTSLSGIPVGGRRDGGLTTRPGSRWGRCRLVDATARSSSRGYAWAALERLRSRCSTPYRLPPGHPELVVRPEEIEWCAAEGIHAVPIDPKDPPRSNRRRATSSAMACSQRMSGGVCRRTHSSPRRCRQDPDWWRGRRGVTVFVGELAPMHECAALPCVIANSGVLKQPGLSETDVKRSYCYTMRSPRRARKSSSLK